MKKINGFLLFSFISLILIQGCTKNEKDFIESTTVAQEPSTYVSVEQATSNLLKFMDEFDMQTRSGKPREITEIITLGGFSETRSAEFSEGQPLVYLFNFSDNKGYALVSGDTRVHDILAFVESGRLDPAKGIDNPGLAIFLSNADTYYQLKTRLPVYNDSGEPVVLSDDGDDGYDPDIDADYVEYSDWEITREYNERELNCSWGQGDPLNRYCYTSNGEKALVGCVAVAVAQIMYYYGYNHTYNGTAYDWNIMRNYRYRYDYEPAEALDMAARLVADLGRPENLNMNYGVDASGASMDNVTRTFRNFGYASVGSLQNLNCNAEKPILVTGYARRQTVLDKVMGVPVTHYNHTNGHTWVIDGSMTQTRYIYTYLYNGTLAKTEMEKRYLYHCNWGWNGQDDGYYLADAFNTIAGPEVRSTSYWEGAAGYYRFLLKMIPNIHP